MFKHEQLKVYFRDGYVDFKDAAVSISNTGFLYGLGVFTGMRAHLNKETGKMYLFRPEEHFRRLSFGCKLCQFRNFGEKYNYDKYVGILRELLQMNNIREDAYFRVSVFSDENTITPKFYFYRDSLGVYLYPIGDYIPVTGIKCMVSSWARVEENALPARAKIVGGYVNSAFAKTEALRNGFDEAIFLNNRGNVVEGSASNIFLMIDGRLVTPQVQDNILEGITRLSIIEIAKDAGLEVVERSIGRAELYKADEVFLTGTASQVAPVVQVDNIPVGSGEVGPVAKKLQTLYSRAVRGEDPRYLPWLLEM